VVNLILHIGSNIGDREKNLHHCVELIKTHLGSILQKSEVYATEAWGIKDQPEFYNQALSITTSLSPHNVQKITQKIEFIIGKEKEYLWGPRKIDIDILFYGNKIINDSILIVPHPRMEQRNFVLVPLMDIISEFIHPVSGLTIREMYTQCKDTSYVHPIIHDHIL